MGKRIHLWLRICRVGRTRCGLRSDVGRRDELILRLGLAGMRVSEIQHITAGGLLVDGEPMLQWIGKRTAAGSSEAFGVD